MVSYHCSLCCIDLWKLQSLLSSPDVNDLQNFVNVALATAAGGEDDLTHDKLSDLRTVGSGFGPLIYNLPEYTCYADLTDRCESLWEALRNSQDLPGKLVRKPCHLNFFHVLSLACSNITK